MSKKSRVLVVGATGSIGRLVVEQAHDAGYQVRVIVRHDADFPADVEVIHGDITSADVWDTACENIDALIFTHGSHEAALIEAVDYGVVRNALYAIRGRDVRIALMTAIGVTSMDTPFNRSMHIHDWKRRSEFLVRASGHPYTIVRPGWFDYNADNEQKIVFLQGDTHRHGSPEDGVIARAAIARVLVESLRHPEAARKTLELVATVGEEQDDLAPLFSALQADSSGSVHGVLDEDNFPLSSQPRHVLDDLEHLKNGQ